MDAFEPILKYDHWRVGVGQSAAKKHTTKQAVKLRELLKSDLRTMGAWLMKEDSDRFWQYARAAWAGKVLAASCTRALLSQLPPMKEMVGTLCSCRELPLN